MSSNRRLKKQRWRTLKFFSGMPYLMRLTLTRKRYRHWYRQYCRDNENAWNNLAPITVRPDPFWQQVSIANPYRTTMFKNRGITTNQ